MGSMDQPALVSTQSLSPLWLHNQALPLTPLIATALQEGATSYKLFCSKRGTKRKEKLREMGMAAEDCLSRLSVLL